MDRPSSVDDPWIDSRFRKATKHDGYVWVALAEGKNPDSLQRILLVHGGYVETMDTNCTVYPHWKPANMEVPSLPGQKIQSKSFSAVLYAWRAENPDHHPDDVPPDSFIKGFEAAQRIQKEKEEATPPF